MFKPSELTLPPASGWRLWAETGLPAGVLNLMQRERERETGAVLTPADIDDLLFTGSAVAGAALRRAPADRPG